MIDLHTHTTASDGRLTPTALVARAARAGVQVLGVTDHDTLGGCAEAANACEQHHVQFVAGIEITAVVSDADVHVLGYFIDTASDLLQQFLSEQRQHRVDRVRESVARLARHGIVLDAEAIVAPALASPGTSVGRPWVARALVAGGFVADTSEAFDRWLGQGCPAFVPRVGASPAEVFARIHAAGGVASLAHPVLVGHDDWIPGFAEAGLDALEAYHSDHDAADTARYLAMARALGLAVSGGSDFHGGDHGPLAPGATALPPAAFQALRDRATTRATASGSSTSS